MNTNQEMRAENVATMVARLVTAYSTLDTDGINELKKHLARQWPCGNEVVLHRAIKDAI